MEGRVQRECMVSGTLDFFYWIYTLYTKYNQKRHSRRERSVLRIKIENQKLKGAVMKNKKSIAILMAAITLASCQSYKKSTLSTKLRITYR